MSVETAAYIVYRVLYGAIPTIYEATRGRLTPARVDERCKDFGKHVVEKTGMRLEVSGRENVPSDGVFVFMSNHQSHLDIPVLYHSLPVERLRMVAKKELFKVPIFGQAISAAGFVEVDRSRRDQAIGALDRAAEQIRGGTHVWIAPEGSRSKDGSIGPLKKGGFHLAKNAAVPIIPVAISGTNRVLPPGGRSIQKDQAVRVVIGHPIEVVGRELPALIDQVREFFVTNVPAYM